MSDDLLNELIVLVNDHCNALFYMIHEQHQTEMQAAYEHAEDILRRLKNMEASNVE